MNELPPLENLLKLMLKNINGKSHVANYNCPFEHTLAYAITLATFSCEAYKDGCILEIGTDSGLGTLALGYGNYLKDFNKLMYTLDINEQNLRDCKTVLDSLGIVNIGYQHGTSGIIHDFPLVSFAYIDGAHDYDSCLYDLNTVSRRLTKTGKMLVHDCTDMNLETQNQVSYAVRYFLLANSDFVGMYIDGGFCLLGRRYM
jgi:hypothetical protein